MSAWIPPTLTDRQQAGFKLAMESNIRQFCDDYHIDTTKFGKLVGEIRPPTEANKNQTFFCTVQLYRLDHKMREIVFHFEFTPGYDNIYMFEPEFVKG